MLIYIVLIYFILIYIRFISIYNKIYNEIIELDEKLSVMLIQTNKNQ